MSTIWSAHRLQCLGPRLGRPAAGPTSLCFDSKQRTLEAPIWTVQCPPLGSSKQRLLVPTISDEVLFAARLSQVRIPKLESNRWTALSKNFLPFMCESHIVTHTGCDTQYDISRVTNCRSSELLTERSSPFQVAGFQLLDCDSPTVRPSDSLD